MPHVALALQALLGEVPGMPRGTIADWTEAIERGGALIILFVFGAVVFFVIIPRQLKNHQAVIDSLLDRHQADMQKIREFYISSLEQQRADFAVQISRIIVLGEKLEKVIDDIRRGERNNK